MPQGFLGVDVFFVISGFVITRSLMQAGDPGRLLPFLERFYRRRFWRLAPALVVVVAVTLLAVAVVVPPVWLSRHIFYTGAGSLFGISNIVLSSASGSGYFSQAADFNPFLHTWSLGVEEQFYVLFPLLFWCVFVWSVRRMQRWARWVIPALAVVSLALAVWGALADPTTSFYLLPTRFWELAAGAIAFTYAERVRAAVAERRALILGWSGLAAVIGALFLPQSWASPFPAGVLPVGGSMLLLVRRDGDRPSRRRRLLAGSPPDDVPRPHLVLPVPVALARHRDHSVDDRRERLVVDPARRCALGRPGGAQLPLRRAAVPVVPALAHRAAVAGGGRCGIGIVSVVIAFYGEGARQSFEYRVQTKPVISSDKVTFDPLHLPTLGMAEAAVDDPEAPRLLVIGDSHAGMHHGASLEVANDAGFRFVGSSVSGCGFTLSEAVDLEGACSMQRDALATLEEGDVVVFAALRLPRYLDQDGHLFVPVDQLDPKRVERRAEALAQFDAIVGDLEGRGVGVVIAGPTPMFEYIPLRCADWFNSMNPVCDGRAEISRDELLERASFANAQIAAVQERHPDAVVWNVFDVLCPGDVCSIRDENGELLFADQDHLGGRGNELVLPSYREAVAAAAAR
ncbi:MAG: acyltransferase [Microbacteriaceae bacterium]|nr:MAG: acyltransferase [Microbacteriaceae bacterium]